MAHTGDKFSFVQVGRCPGEISIAHACAEPLAEFGQGLIAFAAQVLQFGILQLQFNLMHLQLMQQTLGIAFNLQWRNKQPLRHLFGAAAQFSISDSTLAVNTYRFRAHDFFNPSVV